ncbi:MAG: ABC transporter permease [Polyangia bacterium]|jgi:peptide/nickel transport system permease protein
MRKILRRYGAGPVVGAALIAIFFVCAILGPSLAPYGPEQQNLAHLLEAPSHAHLFGTDENGCDLLSEMLFGARLAATISCSVVLICFVVGIAIGTIAGYFGGVVDEVIMRVVDVLLAFPGILLNLAIVAIVPSAGVGVFVFALAINGWVGYARVARGQVLEVREREFVIAARAIGASPWRVMLRHVVPNILSPLIVQATFAFAGVILVEASLSFLGLGNLHGYSWGSLLAQGTTYLWRTQHLAMVPGLAIAMVVLGCNLLGDGLRDRLDPKHARS